MATFAVDQVEIFGKGVLQAEGVVVDKEGNVYGGGRNGIMYKVAPDGTVSELATLPEGSIPNGVTMDRNGDLVYCDLGKQAMMRVSQSGEVSLIADQIGSLKLTLPNFASYDAEGNLYVSNSSTSSIENVLAELATPSAKGALGVIRPHGKTEIVAEGIYLANGTAIDPKEDAVYVLESTRNDCLRIQIKKDGTFGKPEIYSKDFPSLPDGMAFDVDGNMYVTLPAVVKGGDMTPAHQVIAIDTNGNWSMLIDDSAEGKKLNFPTNCAFGGPNFDDLYIAHLEADHVAKVHLGRKGHQLYDRR